MESVPLPMPPMPSRPPPPLLNDDRVALVDGGATPVAWGAAVVEFRRAVDGVRVLRLISVCVCDGRVDASEAELLAIFGGLRWARRLAEQDPQGRVVQVATDRSAVFANIVWVLAAAGCTCHYGCQPCRGREFPGREPSNSLGRLVRSLLQDVVEAAFRRFAKPPASDFYVELRSRRDVDGGLPEDQLLRSWQPHHYLHQALNGRMNASELQRLVNRSKALWLPTPLDARIGGDITDIEVLRYVNDANSGMPLVLTLVVRYRA